MLTKHSSWALLLLMLPPGRSRQSVSASPQKLEPYSMSVSVKEVEIIVHAWDVHHRPVLDLKPEEIDLFDNEQGPGRIVSMRQLGGRPLRVAFVIDTSGSVASLVARSRAEAAQASQTLLEQTADEGADIEFARSRHVLQGWTHHKDDLIKTFSPAGAAPHDPIDGTSIYDTLFSTCLYEFGESKPVSATNVIVLFSDGQDTTSTMTLRASIDSCHRNHTIIYAFSPKPLHGTSSTGPSILQSLTEQTGGQVFYTDDSPTGVQSDLETLRSELQSEYALFYRPGPLKHDGAFHRIILIGPERVASIMSTSGFFAPGP
jgi:Ca-activated chloride channel family protein